MRRRYLLGAAVLCLVLVIALGFCVGGSGGGVVVDDHGSVPPAGLAPNERPLYTASPTATPWPAFTPVVVAPVAPTSTPWPTFTPEPTDDSSVRSVAISLLGSGDRPVGGGSAVDAVPTATPVQEFSPVDAPVVRQTFFPLQSVQLPDSIAENRLENLPEPVRTVRVGVPFLIWGVWFDFREAPEDFEMEAMVRWVTVGGTMGDLVVHQSQVELSRNVPFFYSGLGDPHGRVWKPGSHRVELVSQRGNRLVSWSFEVR